MPPAALPIRADSAIRAHKTFHERLERQPPRATVSLQVLGLVHKLNVSIVGYHGNVFRCITLSVESYDITLMIFIQRTKEFQKINWECLYYSNVFIKVKLNSLVTMEMLRST